MKIGDTYLWIRPDCEIKCTIGFITEDNVWLDTPNGPLIATYDQVANEEGFKKINSLERQVELGFLVA